MVSERFNNLHVVWLWWLHASMGFSIHPLRPSDKTEKNSFLTIEMYRILQEACGDNSKNWRWGQGKYDNQKAINRALLRSPRNECWWVMEGAFQLWLYKHILLLKTSEKIRDDIDRILIGNRVKIDSYLFSYYFKYIKYSN